MKTEARSSRFRKGSAGGFSLFEIVIALAILAMLTGTVFGIIWKVGDAAEEIRIYDTRDEQISRFLGLIRQTIESLPSSGSIEMVPPEETGSGFYEMTISGAPTAFHFGDKSIGNGDSIIGLRPQAEALNDAAFADDPDSPPLYEIALSQEDFAPSDADGDGMVFGAGGDDGSFLQADENGRYWLPVLNGITEMTWRFWDAEQRDWIDVWEEDDRMPELLELSLNDRYRPAPIRVVFEVPSHLSDPPQQQQQAPASGSSGSSGSTAGGGGAPGGGGGGPPGGGGGRPGGGDGGGRPGFGPGGGDGPRPGFGPGGPGGRPGGPGGPGGRPGGGDGGGRGPSDGGDGGGRGDGGGGRPGGGGGGSAPSGGSGGGGGGNSGGGGAGGGGGGGR